MGGIGGDAAASAAVESSEADEGRTTPTDADDDNGDHSSSADSTSSGDLSRETRTPLLRGPRDGSAHAEAAELQQIAANMPGQNQVRCGHGAHKGPLWCDIQ
jgi:osmotically-inducible protein OsmY